MGVVGVEQRAGQKPLELVFEADLLVPTGQSWSAPRAALRAAAGISRK